MPVRKRAGDATSYELVSHLASGGMAELFLARRCDAGPDAPLVVLKRILPHQVRNPEFVSMFLDEARLASRLDHPNIARVIEVGRIEDTYFYAMEYVRGKNLREVVFQAAIKRMRIPLEVAVRVLACAAAGLHAAHEACDLRGRSLEIVHRDVSPSNVMIGHDGAVKIVDFGIAKAADRVTETLSGMIKGKTAYLSPEQCRVRPQDRRSDIFSLGIVAWELLTQSRLFRFDNDFDTMNAIIRARIPAPSEIVADLPAAIDAVVLRALARDPDARFPTAAAFATALIAALRRPVPPDAPAQVSRLLSELFGEPTEQTPPLELRRDTFPSFGTVRVEVIGGAEAVGAVGDDGLDDDVVRVTAPYRVPTVPPSIAAAPVAATPAAAPQRETIPMGISVLAAARASVRAASAPAQPRAAGGLTLASTEQLGVVRSAFAAKAWRPPVVSSESPPPVAGLAIPAGSASTLPVIDDPAPGAAEDDPVADAAEDDPVADAAEDDPAPGAAAALASEDDVGEPLYVGPARRRLGFAVLLSVSITAAAVVVALATLRRTQASAPAPTVAPDVDPAHALARRAWTEAHALCEAGLARGPDPELSRICAMATCMLGHHEAAIAHVANLAPEVRGQVEAFCREHDHPLSP